MLRILKQDEFDRHIDFAYSLALDQSKSAYPTYTDGVKTKSDFIERAKKAFEREHEAILLFEHDGKTEGWIHYYALAEDRYLSFCTFNVSAHAAQAVDETLAYLSERYQGYTIYFGLPSKNTAVIARLRELSFEKDSENEVGILFFDDYVPMAETDDFVKVDASHFSDFAALHQIHDDDMYWNNEHLLADLENWEIYLLCRDEKVLGAIYFCFAGDMTQEIFGIDYADDRYDAEVFRSLLTKALNEGKKAGGRHMIFFHDEKEASIVSTLGFRYIGKYVLYVKGI